MALGPKRLKARLDANSEVRRVLSRGPARGGRRWTQTQLVSLIIGSGCRSHGLLGFRMCATFVMHNLSKIEQQLEQSITQVATLKQ